MIVARRHGGGLQLLLVVERDHHIHDVELLVLLTRPKKTLKYKLLTASEWANEPHENVIEDYT